MSLVVIVQNDGTGTEHIGHYNYVVRIGDGTHAGSTSVATGRIERHARADGWAFLLERVLAHARRDGALVGGR